MINVADLIGKPFKIGARGPKEYDCYGLVIELYKRIGIELPDYESPKDGAVIAAMMADKVKLWENAPLFEGAVILFKIPGSTHVGLYLSNDKFIHCWEGIGVTVERLSSWKTRIIGIYRYVG